MSERWSDNAGLIPVCRCFAPDPESEGVRCLLAAGHDGPHMAQAQTWLTPDERCES